MGGFGAIYPSLSHNCIYVGEYTYHIIPKIKQNLDFVPFFYKYLPICNPDGSNTPRKSRYSGDTTAGTVLIVFLAAVSLFEI